MSIAVLGGGLSGLLVSYFIRKQNVTIFEKENECGGLCKSRCNPKCGEVTLQSIRATFLSNLVARAAPRFTTVVVFPTPPFPEITPIILVRYPPINNCFWSNLNV